MTIDALYLVMAFLVGMGTGIVFFGGLWWTVRRLSAVRHPAVFTVGSFLVRTSVTLTALYLASGGHWERILIGLLGFTAARFFLIRRLRPALTPRSSN